MHRLGLIAVAGIVGVGKTTLARQLAQALFAHLIEEPYDRNPFLARQYGGDRRASFASQVYFLLSRIDQLHPANLAAYPTAVADYIYEKDRLFARVNLDDTQFALYEQLTAALWQPTSSPRGVIYLQDSIDNCLARIAQRGRSFEQHITLGWLKKLQDAYDELFANWGKHPGATRAGTGTARCPVIRVDCAEMDVREAKTVDLLVERLAAQVDCNLHP